MNRTTAVLVVLVAVLFGGCTKQVNRLVGQGDGDTVEETYAKYPWLRPDNPADLRTVWYGGHVPADGGEIRLSLEVVTQTTNTFSGHFYILSAALGGEFIGTFESNGDMPFTVTPGGACSDVHGVARIGGDRNTQMTIRIDGPSICNMPYTLIEGVITKHGK